jgi:hypothetical protein
MNTSSFTTSSSCQRSRPALVNRTNSDDLNDLALAGAAATGKGGNKKTSPRRSRKGTKQQTSNASAASQATSAHDSPRRRVVDRNENNKVAGSSNSEKQGAALLKTSKQNQQRASTNTLPTVSSYDASSDDDRDDDTIHINNNSTNNNNNNNNNSNKMITWEHGWLHDDGLTKTSVYYRNLHRPISLLQAVMRGQRTRLYLRQARIQQLKANIWQLQNVAALRIQASFRCRQERQARHVHIAARCIQTRVRLIQEGQARAITPLQSLVRGWIARLQYQALLLQQQLAHIRARHELEMRGIRQAQKHEMKRIDMEYQVIAGKENKRHGQRLEAASEEMYAWRRQNRTLRHENATLQKASLVLTQKNEQTVEVTAIHKANIKQLQEHVVPHFERDQAQIVTIHDDYVQRIQRYEEALEVRHEHLRFERTVTQCLQQSIQVLLQHIDDRCQDESLKRSILQQARETLRGVATSTNKKEEEEEEEDNNSSSSA